LDFLTYKQYKERIKKSKEYWQSYLLRWYYHKQVIDILKRSNTNNPKKVLELGTMGVTIVTNSDTMDYDEKFNFPDMKPTYPHDARSLPWPIEDKQYEWFVALRVFQHLYPFQKECFKEATRIAKNVIILVPNEYPSDKGVGISLEQFVKWNDDIPPTIVECVPLKTPHHHLYCWISRNSFKSTRREKVETWLHLNFPTLTRYILHNLLEVFRAFDAVKRKIIEAMSLRFFN